MLRTLIACAALILAHLALPNRTAAATIGATSCSAAAVQAAIDSAADYDTITIPAGSCTWTVKVTTPASKGLTIQGAGIGKTTLIRGASLPDAMLEVYGEGKYSRVTGITFDSAWGTATHARGLSVNLGTIAGGTIRVDHNQFTRTYRRAIHVNSDGVLGTVLVDHNTFFCGQSGGSTVCQSVSVDFCDNGIDPENAIMSQPLTLGMAGASYQGGAVYVEDNEAFFEVPQDGFVEGYACARLVVRFNKLHGAQQGHHGGELRRGTQQYEYYNNAFDTNGMTAPWSGRIHQIRSGVGFSLNNTATSSVKGGIDYDIYRVRYDYAHFGLCNGTAQYDGNRGSGSTYPAAGWPCMDQTGWLFGYSPGSFVRSPSYVFGNTREDGSMFVAGAIYPAYLQEDREYFNENRSFNGSSGVGIGTRAQMDGISCSRDYVGFWVTNEGEWNSTNGSTPDGRFYICRSGKWTLHYTPYSYPNPIQFGAPASTTSGPSAPSNLRIVSQ